MIANDKGGSLQQRKVRSDGWTVEVRAKFLGVLAQTCNVKAACAAVKKQPCGAYLLKKRDGEFARLWAEAVEDGQEILRERLIACALGQIPSGDNPEAVSPAAEPVPFDTKLALDVLRLQNGGRGAKRAGAPPKQFEIDEALLLRLEALADKPSKP